MHYSFCGHLLSGILTVLAIFFSSAALFSCFWSSFYVRQSGRLHGSGLFGQGRDGVCRDVFKNGKLPGFVSATLAFMFIGFGLQIIQTVMLVASCFLRKHSSVFLKADIGLMIAIFLCFTTSCIVYGTVSPGYFRNLYVYEVELGWSFVFAVVADVITVLEMFPLGWAMVYINDKGDQEFALVENKPRRNRRTRNDNRNY